MKKCFLFLILFSTALCAEQLAPGIFYHHQISQIPFALSIHFLEVQPEHARIALVASHNRCHGAQTTSEMAQEENALAAINGSFFDFFVASKLHHFLTRFLDLFGYQNYDAFPIWAMKIKEHWFATAAQSMAVLAWHQDGKEATIVQAACHSVLRVGSELLPITTVNKPFADGPILYTSVYGNTTPENSARHELIIQNGIIITITQGGNTEIPENGFVYAFTPFHLIPEVYQVNTAAEVQISLVNAETFELLPQTHWDYLRASIPLLLKDHAIPARVVEHTNEFYTRRHPRTAVGIRDNGDWILVVVDGRQEHSEGLTLFELASLMAEYGCKHALNLGGGGDSTMVINGAVVNKPSGRRYTLVKKERPISDAILVFAR
jgi:hypothetical protein